MNRTSIGRMGVRLLGRLGRNIFWGTAWGLGMGAAFCLIGLTIVAVRGPRILHVYGITLQTMMVTYLAGAPAQAWLRG